MPGTSTRGQHVCGVCTLRSREGRGLGWIHDRCTIEHRIRIGKLEVRLQVPVRVGLPHDEDTEGAQNRNRHATESRRSFLDAVVTAVGAIAAEGEQGTGDEDKARWDRDCDRNPPRRKIQQGVIRRLSHGQTLGLRLKYGRARGAVARGAHLRTLNDAHALRAALDRRRPSLTVVLVESGGADLLCGTGVVEPTEASAFSPLVRA
jgi:hypothetical protein